MAGHLGLVRFDGVRFVVFNTANTPELATNQINCLWQSRDGRLWVGTGQGLLSYHDRRFTVYITSEGLADDYVNALYGDASGTLWIATNKAQLIHETKPSR